MFYFPLSTNQWWAHLNGYIWIIKFWRGETPMLGPNSIRSKKSDLFLVSHPSSFMECSGLRCGLTGKRANTDLSSCGRPLTLKMVWSHQQSGDEDRWVIIIFSLTFYLNVLILENLEIISKKEEITAKLNMLLYVLVYTSACLNLATYVFSSLYVSGRIYVHTFM